MVPRPDLQRRGPLGDVGGGGVERRADARLVDAAETEPAGPRRKGLGREHDRLTAVRQEPDLDLRESRAAIVRGDLHRGGATDEVDRRLERDGRGERLRASQEKYGGGRHDDEGDQQAHQESARSTARRLRVIRCVAPQMTWPSTGYVSIGISRPPKSQSSRRSAPGAMRTRSGTVKIASTSCGQGRRS